MTIIDKIEKAKAELSKGKIQCKICGEFVFVQRKERTTRVGMIMSFYVIEHVCPKCGERIK